MLVDSDDHPKLGRAANLLGIRTVVDGHIGVVDIEVRDGLVRPGPRGMSVAPQTNDLPIHRIPRRLRYKYPEAHGRNDLAIWAFGSGQFTAVQITNELSLVLTSASHGVLSPAFEMPLSRFEASLNATRPFWERIE